MTSTNETEKINDLPTSEPPPAFGDMAALVDRVHLFLQENRADTTSADAGDPADFARRFGFVEKGKGNPEVILADDVAVELGHPSTESVSAVLLTYDRSKVIHGRIRVVGGDIDRAQSGSKESFAQIVIVALAPNQPVDPFDLDNVQFLTNRLPGYMVRSVPGRLWARISKKAAAAGLTLEEVGRALVASYSGDFDAVQAVEVVLVAGNEHKVQSLKPIATEAQIMAGKHKKLALGLDGELECSDLDCDSCDEQPVCDSLRDVVIKRRKRKNEREQTD